MYVRLSGLRADPNIDFILDGEITSIRAVDYLLAYTEFMETLPEELLMKLEEDPTALHDHEDAWSIEYFRDKLSGVLEGSEAFYRLLYKGLDNSMGDMQRSLIVYSINDPNKAQHGTFDLPEQKVSGTENDQS